MRDLERGNRKWSQAIFHLPSFYDVLWKWWLSVQHQLCGGYLRCSLIFLGDITVLASVLNRFKYRSYSSGFNHNIPRTKSNENQKTYFVNKCILVHGGKPIFLHSCFSCISPWVICSCLHRQQFACVWPLYKRLSLPREENVWGNNSIWSFNPFHAMLVCLKYCDDQHACDKAYYPFGSNTVY